MMVHARPTRVPALVLVMAALILAGCARFRHGDPAPPEEDPVSVHVRNQNFLDMNVAVVVSGVSRRLGTVTGNSMSDFTIPWPTVNGQTVNLIATPIGGRGRATSQPLSLSPGQVVEFTVAPILQQSTAVVRQP